MPFARRGLTAGHNERLTTMTTQVTSKFYSAFFKSWVKALGAKPSDTDLATIHALGARPGKQALANAMMLRPEGATASQIVLACGAPQLNKMRELVARKLVKRDMNVAPSEAGHTVYKITLAPAGVAKVAKAEVDAKAEATAQAAKPANVKKARKASNKAKARVAVAKAAFDKAATEAALATVTVAPHDVATLADATLGSTV